MLDFSAQVAAKKYWNNFVSSGLAVVAAGHGVTTSAAAATVFATGLHNAKAIGLVTCFHSCRAVGQIAGSGWGCSSSEVRVTHSRSVYMNVVKSMIIVLLRAKIYDKNKINKSGCELKNKEEPFLPKPIAPLNVPHPI